MVVLFTTRWLCCTTFFSHFYFKLDVKIVNENWTMKKVMQKGYNKKNYPKSANDSNAWLETLAA